MIDRNDPRLTAYALGEMDALERAEFEKVLAADPPARAEVDAIRAFGGRMSAELARSTAPELTTAQRASVAKAARRQVPVVVLAFAAAACLVLGVTVYLATRSPSGVVNREHFAREELSVKDLDELVPNDAAQPRTPEPSESPFAYEMKSETRAPVELPREAEEKPALAPEAVAPEEAATGMSTGGGGGLPESPSAGVGGGPRPDAVPRPTKEEGAKKRLGDGGLMVAAPAGAHKRKAMEPVPSPSDREGYDRIRDNPFVRVAEEDSSTFSIDVDTASYANVRRFLQQQHRLPPSDAVRVEEMINYFSYAYEPPPAGSPHPFRIHVEVAPCPWESAHRLARVAIKGKTIDHRERPDSNLVFLVDVSGSMDQPDKLPLVLASLRMLAENLGERDRVAIAVYAGAAGLVLPSTGDKRQVIEALGRLRAGGSTAGAAGIELAYQVAAENFIKGGTNRVILCTDGDFNVGISDDGSLTRLIEEKAKTGVFLSVLGFGTGNYQDAKMQQLADKGNGNHAYIDSILEARKVLGEEMSATLVTIAKDVKIQLFFNPRTVAGFRLIGYENRLLAKQDFNDDTKDAGEIGAGHCVTALYELVPVGTEVPAAPAADENPFVAKAGLDADSAALFQLRLRYKQPDGDKSELLEQMVVDGDGTFDKASPDFRWAAAVAAFGMNLRGTAGMGLDAVLEIAKGAAGEDKYRREFLELVQTAKLLSPLTSGFLGVINGVRGNLVGISAGSEEGVRIGDILSLSRGAEYVGRVVITSVDKKQSVGEFDTQFPGNGAPPQVGDKALLSR